MFIVPITRHTARHAAHRSHLLDATLARFFASATPETAGDTSEAVRRPALDVAESEHAYTVKLEMPGVAKEDVKVSVEGRRVSLQAQAAPKAAPAAETAPSEEKPATERLLYSERTPASYARSFTLPQEVELTEAAAKLEHGVLTLTLPKRGARSAATLTVN